MVDRQPTLSLPQVSARAIAFYRQGRHAEAGHLCRAILAIRPSHYDALHVLGCIKLREGNHTEAVLLLTRAIREQPDAAEPLCNLGIGLKALGRFDEAIASYNKALEIKPDYAEAWNNRANALGKLDRHEEALANYDHALANKPELADAWNNRGVALDRLDRGLKALASYERALAIAPQYADALNNRGVTLEKLNRYEEAIASYERGLAFNPGVVPALSSRGDALLKLGRYDEAFASYERVLAITPNDAETLYRRGSALEGMHGYAEAIASYEAALAADPDHAYALGAWANCELQVCNWNETARLADELAVHVAEAKSIIKPFTFLGYSDEPSLQLICAKQFLQDAIGPRHLRIGNGTIHRHDRIRVAYLSSHFRRHPGAYLIAELIELHDRSRFEIIGVSFGRDDGSDIRKRILTSFDRCYDVRSESDREIAKLLNDVEVDIAVDRNGHTEGARPGILACRPSPIQVSYLGYPGTMGADYIDYVIADRIVLPFDQQPFYVEKIVHLPDTYQVNDSKRQIAARVPSRGEAGLPEHGIVFCCFNKNYKITAAVFDVWIRLLRAVDGSVLWLFQANDLAAANLRREAEGRGIDSARLVFAPRLALEDHLARHSLADLFLDTLPYNAHTTASDALWAGLLVLTCRGNTFAGRVGASLLHAIGLPELVTDSLEEYEALALRLATDPGRLGSIRRKLEHNRRKYPLFNANRFRRHIEAAYTTMWELSQSGEGPRSFSVEPVA